MAQLQRAARMAFGRGEIDWEDDSIVAIPVSAAPDPITHVYASSMAGFILGDEDQRVEVAATLVALSNGRVRYTCAAFAHDEVPAGGTYAGTMFVKNTGSDASSVIISYHQRSTGVIPTNDQDINVTVPAEGLFTI